MTKHLTFIYLALCAMALMVAINQYTAWQQGRAIETTIRASVDSTLAVRCPQMVRATQDFDVLCAQTQYHSYILYKHRPLYRTMLQEYRDYWDKK